MDRTNNKQGIIRFYTDLDIKISDQTFQERFYITGLGNQKVILGLPWLRKHNPEISMEKLRTVKKLGKRMATKEGIHQKKTTTDHGKRRRSGINKEPFFEPLIGHRHGLTGIPELGR